ncbi:MAG: gamma-glutamyltransferase [Bradyrhizobium sp.]|nr:gamma-glutamyltransferase [Bradyrhizobium sp.]
MLAIGTTAIAQEKSQSGLELVAPRAQIDQPIRAPHAMIASVNEIATRVGLDILRKGGNAVDAATAVAMALAVVHPEAGNLGGSGHMLIRMADGRTASIDYSGMAPAATRADLPLKDLEVGYKAVAVPGTPAGFGLAQARFGKLSWRTDLEPARLLAANGFPASQRMEIILKLQVPVMKQFPETAKIFLHGSDKPLKQGELVVQSDLAATLARMQKYGWEEFYRGKTAQLIAADMAAHHGWITEQDMRSYHAEIHDPLKLSYRGYPILTVAPTASGGIALAVALNTLETQSLPLGSEGSSRARQLQIEALRRAYEIARTLNRDHTDIPIEEVTSKTFARKLATDMTPGRVSPRIKVETSHNAPETTHFSIIDAAGDVVSNTYTLSGFYGSQVVAKGTGVMLNNHMFVFSRKPGARDYLAPGQRYITPMAATIILQPDGTPMAAFGSPGGASIPSTVFQIITNLIDFKMPLRDAIEYPRIHYNLDEDTIEAEPGALVTDVADNLRTMGYKINPKWRSQGDVNAIGIEPGSGWRLGSSDGRRGGVALGY